MREKRNLGKKECLRCGKVYIVKASNQKYCSRECGKVGVSMKRYEERSKDREFSDMTITLVAVTELKGKDVHDIIKECAWDKEAFERGLRENRKRIDERKKAILGLRSDKIKCTKREYTHVKGKGMHFLLQ